MQTIKPGLYALTNQLQGEALKIAVTAALQGGISVLQYRDKTSDSQRRYNEAKMLKELCDEYQVPLIINDDINLTQEVAAAGVHLGKEDAPLALAREQLGEQAIIGISCYNSFALAQQAVCEGANYVAFGACFPSLSKPNATPTDLNTITLARQQLNVPIVAIGGITLENAHQVLTAGANSLAVIHNLFNAENIIEQAVAFRNLIQEFNS
ncbi:MAG: thiamine phosphate synthase [Gammaproteobacteria bacterium]